jgi:hypothetical protein
MGLKESKTEVLKLYEEINMRSDCTDDGAATLTLAAVLHAKNATVSVHTGETISGPVGGRSKF